MVTEVKSGLSLLPWLSSLLQTSWQRKAWFVAKADTESQSRSMMAAGTAHRRWRRPRSIHTVAAVGRLWLLGGGAVPPWHPQDMFQTPHSIHAWLGDAPLSPLRVLLPVPPPCWAQHWAGFNSHIGEMGIAIIPGPCLCHLFPAHPCRICVLAG